MAQHETWTEQAQTSGSGSYAFVSHWGCSCGERSCAHGPTESAARIKSQQRAKAHRLDNAAHMPAAIVGRALNR